MTPRVLSDLDDRPEWLAERTQHLHAWRSPQRFAALARQWRGQRFDGDEIAYSLLEAWRYRDEHLQRYEAGLVRGALGHRRDVYRRLAAELASRYRMLVVDDADLRAFQRSPATEADEHENRTAKRQQRLVAGSELRSALLNAFGPGRVVKTSAKDITRRCSACLTIDEWDRESSGRVHRCSACGAEWDQDANACRNLLREGRRAQQDADAACDDKLAAGKPSRSQRLRAARKRQLDEQPLDEHAASSADN